jgi:hypothetical protein
LEVSREAIDDLAQGSDAFVMVNFLENPASNKKHPELDAYSPIGYVCDNLLADGVHFASSMSSYARALNFTLEWSRAWMYLLMSSFTTKRYQTHALVLPESFMHASWPI